MSHILMVYYIQLHNIKYNVLMLITEVNHIETFKEERNKLSTSVSHKYQI